VDRLSESMRDLIGALELGNPRAGVDDGALEAATDYAFAGPSSTPAQCHSTYWSPCRRPNDGAPETAGEIHRGQPRSSN
jgi:hypothetical protein